VVTISGANFGTTQGTVAFNGAPSSVSSWSPNSITAVVPPTATSGNVVVTVGGLASNGSSFTVATSNASYVNSKYCSATGTCTTDWPVTAGNVLIVMFSDKGSDPGGNISDTQANIYTTYIYNGNYDSVLRLYGAALTSGGAPLTVSSNVAHSRILLAEFSGVSLVSDGIAQSQTYGSGVCPGSAPLSLTTIANDLLISVLAQSTQNGATTVTGGGTTAQAVGSGPGAFEFVYQLLSPGTYTSQFSFLPSYNAGNQSCAMVALRTGTSTTNISSTSGSLGQVVPVISNISPLSGPVGVTVTITGNNFGTTPGTVTFNGTTAAIKSWNSSTITAVVPSGGTSGNVVVTIGGLVSNGSSFTVTVPPAITSLAPTSGPAGALVTITGTGFGTTQGTVSFAGLAASVTSWSSTSIVAQVPSGASSGSVVVTASAMASNAANFTVTSSAPPDNSGISYVNSKYCSASNTCTTDWPVSPGNLMLVLIYGGVGDQGGDVYDGAGNGFTPYASQGNYSVNFSLFGRTIDKGGSPLTVLTSAPHSRIVLAEFAGVTGVLDKSDGANVNTGSSGVCPGSRNLSVTTSTSDLLIAVLGESVTNGKTTFTTGTLMQGIGSGDGAFQFLYQTAPSTGTYTDQFTFAPSYNAGNLSCAFVAFRAKVKPTITSITPASGPVGRSITIVGSNFWPEQGASTVTLNALPAQVTAWSSTSITAVVPSGATSGNLVVTVAGQSSDGYAFSVTQPEPAWGITMTHTGNFTQGQTANYTITVSNGPVGGSSTGTVSVTTTWPTGLTLVSLSGSGWTCSGAACTRADSLSAGSSYPPINANVTVSTTAASPLQSSVQVSGGSSTLAASATDSTVVLTYSTSVRVVTTSTQAILTYSAPDTNACSVKISESPSFTPLVQDVDPQIFPGANLDSRLTGISQGTTRVFVAGARSSERSPDANAYSRALQANTVHYYQITCGTSTATGTFATQNIPLGSTYSDPPQLDPLTPGASLMPTLLNTRGTSVIDPQTGALLKRVSMLEDGGSDVGPGLFSGGFVRVCGPNLVGPGPGYLCALDDGGSPGLLYYIVPSTGEIRFLGHLNGAPSATIDPVDNEFYGTVYDSTGASVTRAKYIGDFANAAPTYAAPLLTETFIRGLGGLIQAFDSAFDPASFGCAFRTAAHPAAAQYGLLECRRSIQDSYGWVALLDMGARLPAGNCGSDPTRCPHIVAAAKTFDNPGSRWCGLHNVQLIPGPVISITPHALLDSTNGLGTGTYQTRLTSAVSAGQTLIAVSGEPSNGGPADAALPVAQVGDWFTFSDGEHVTITQKNSSTSWLISPPKNSHAAGITLFADCIPGGVGGYRQLYWKFLDDPHGKDTTNSSYVVDHYWPAGGHDDWGTNLRVTEDYVAVAGPVATNLNTPITFSLDSSPLFAGARAPAYGETTKKHPSYHQSNALPLDQGWFLDYAGFAGGNLYSPTPGASLVSGQLYKYLFGSGASLGSRKAQATLAVSGVNPLRDISGPNSSIGDTSQYSYTYCVAYLAGECRPGALPGDVFANVPNVKEPSCTFNGTTADLCIGPYGTYAQGIVQLGLTPNQVGEPAGSGISGAGYSRVLTSGLVPLRQTDSYPLAKALPDGSWAFFNYSGSPRQVWMVKMPPYQSYDAVDRSGFVPLRVDLVAPSDSRIRSAVIEFGYAEQGATDQYYCSSRREACVAVSSMLNQSDPFKYALSDQYTGVPCQSSCSVTIPVLPMHVVYYRARYLDGTGAVVAYGPPSIGAEGTPVN
jgi:IPT/TIG domain